MQLSALRKNIPDIISNAWQFNLTKGATMNTTELNQDAEHFLEALRIYQIDSVLVGGLAMLNYVAGRNTEDMDLLVVPKSLDVLPAFTIHDENLFFARANYKNLQIDLRYTTQPLFDYIYKNERQSAEYDGTHLEVATVQGLMLLKLFALPSLYRQGDFAKVGLYENDVATLLQHYQPDRALLKEILQTYLSADEYTEIEHILEELQQRIHRFEQKRHH